jgi:hypothetical protein
MLWEGMLTEGLAITRAVHDRYHPSRRNPWNEVECGDHYARSMASYGVFLAACGFQYDGPKGHLAFAPRLKAAPSTTFRCAFTAAEGWGTFTQAEEADTLRATVGVRWGRLRLRSLALAVPASKLAKSATVTANGRVAASRFEQTGGQVIVTLEQNAVVSAGEVIEVSIS